MSARSGIQNALAFVPDIQENITNAFSILKSATDDPGSRMEMANTLMTALENLSCLADEIKAALDKLPEEPNGGGEIRNLATALSRSHHGKGASQ